MAGLSNNAVKEEPGMDSTPARLPSGTVTFLFTDIEGSTQRWEANREAMQDAVRHHDELLRNAIETHGGIVFKTIGDAFCAAFSRPEDAAAAALEVQQRLHADDFSAVGGVRVRVALHTGTADERGGDYFGPTVNKVARLLAVGHGGQILLSGITADLVRGKLPDGAVLHNLGRHRLKDLAEATDVAQLTLPELPHEFPELRSLDAQPNNLPVQLTAFIGRDDALQEGKALLEKARLLTLVGAGGVGKTRIAVQLAADVSDRFPDGVWFVDLAPLTEGLFISPTMLSTMGVREEAGRDTNETLATHLRDKSALIVLDNCEHVVAEAARLVERLLRDCPKLKILATTREALGIPAETVFRVSTFGESDGTQLFLTRAQAVSPSFALTPQNAELVGQICRRLDGIALAIELAAARVKMMSVEDLWKRLDDRFRILTGGSRTALARQQTLRGLIDWSYNLLDEPEKVLLRRLAIFAGDFSLDTATAVCAFDQIDDFEALDILTHLIDKSLVQFEPTDARYWLLDSTKAYALERLADAGEWEALQKRRVAHFSQTAEESRLASLDGRGDEVRYQVGRDYADYRSVMQWALVDGNDVESGAATAGGLYRYWQERALWREGRFWLEHVLQHPSDVIGAASLARAHHGLGAMSFVVSDVASIETHGTEAQRLYAEVGDSVGVVASRNVLAIGADLRGHPDKAIDLYRQNLAQCREIGNKGLEATTLLNLAEALLRSSTRYEEAEQLLTDAMQILRDKGDSYMVAAALDTQALLACHTGQFERAEALLREAIAIFAKIGDEQKLTESFVNIFLYRALSGDLAKTVEAFENTLGAIRKSSNLLTLANFADANAALANIVEDFQSVAAFHAFARMKRSEANVPEELPIGERLKTIVAHARDVLGDGEYAEAEARGRALSLEALLDASGTLVAQHA